MDVEQRARELLAAEYDKVGGWFAAECVRNCDPRWNAKAALNAIIAALTPPEGYVLVPVELPDMGEAPRFVEGYYNRRNWQAAIDDLRWLAARPEVKP